MQIGSLQGQHPDSDFFVYAAADAHYFDQHARPLINSVIKNTLHSIHIHLNNPRPDQIELCQTTPRLSATWEYTNKDQFQSAINFWSDPKLANPYLARRNRMLGIKVVDKTLSFDDNLLIWLQKTYYACVRFIRLAQIIKSGQSFLAIDVDGIVRKSLDFSPHSNHDFYLYLKEKGGHLAGVLLGTGGVGSHAFVQELSHNINAEIARDNIYWFLDQDCLDSIVHKYNKGYLPMTYIDWHMQDHSAIWSAKGKRKELQVFKLEQDKYR